MSSSEEEIPTYLKEEIDGMSEREYEEDWDEEEYEEDWDEEE